MKIKCAIFDFDGTLFDSMFIWENIGELFLHSLGKEPKPFMYEDIKTMSLYESASYFQKEYDLSLSVEEIMTGINQMIENYYFNKINPKKGVIKFLDKMKSLHIPMCIASATDRYLIEAALDRCHMTHYFDAIFTCGEVGAGKNESIIYEKAMTYFHADQNTTIVFEDAFHAICCAQSIGLFVIGVFDKSESNQEEVKKLTDCYIYDYQYDNHFWKFINKENNEYENSINNCRK